MPLARAYDQASGRVASTLHDGYRDRLSRDSDIREHLPFLYEAAARSEHGRVIELGTRTGNSSLAFLAALEDRPGGGHLWSADAADCAGDPEGMAPWAACPWWTFIRGDDLHPAVRAALPAECDVLFIDTSHEYGHTLAELRAYAPRVVPGGLVLCHDTNITGWPGYQWDRDTPPVQAALDEWCAENGMTWENLDGRFGMGVIRP